MNERKRPSELTDVELEQMCSEAGAIISELSEMDPTTLEPKKQREREEMLQQALELGQMLELERIGRLMAKLHSKVEQLKIKAAAEQEREGGPRS